VIPAPILVLVELQDLVNIAAAFRIAKNFGIDQVRLVRPREFDAWRIEGIAHNTSDLLERARLFETLDEALADVVWATALTARERREKRSVLRPRPAAEALVARAAEGPVAFVVGREDKGLPNEALDRCQALVTIPTNPAHRSLNVAQAICVMAWECWMARIGGEGPLKPPKRRAGTATGEQHERLFADWATMLETIEFFKTRQPDIVMRSIREAIYRAELDGREATLLRAIALEVVRYLARTSPPRGGAGGGEGEADYGLPSG
jgi:tRNA/rRNA methyltransferase/tRNA (cytidine32/uridine32-2'-O)-methyltransferase